MTSVLSDGNRDNRSLHLLGRLVLYGRLADNQHQHLAQPAYLLQRRKKPRQLAGRRDGRGVIVGGEHGAAFFAAPSGDENGNDDNRVHARPSIGQQFAGLRAKTAGPRPSAKPDTVLYSQNRSAVAQFIESVQRDEGRKAAKGRRGAPVWDGGGARLAGPHRVRRGRSLGGACRSGRRGRSLGAPPRAITFPCDARRARKRPPPPRKPQAAPPRSQADRPSAGGPAPGRRPSPRPTSRARPPPPAPNRTRG